MGIEILQSMNFARKIEGVWGGIKISSYRLLL